MTNATRSTLLRKHVAEHRLLWMKKTPTELLSDERRPNTGRCLRLKNKGTRSDTSTCGFSLDTLNMRATAAFLAAPNF